MAVSVRRAIGAHVRIEHGAERPGDFGGKDVSGEKARCELGWTPKVAFEDGLRQTKDWFRQKWGS